MSRGRGRGSASTPVTLGQWRLEELLGKGGNGEVWRVRRPNGEIGALKRVTSPKRERLDRFKREIEFLIDHPDEPGILPIVDHSLEESRAWYVMPEATLLRAALGRDPDPTVVVSAFSSYASTLARLSGKGVGHRDIKPDNLFYWNSEWVIGDFGLVLYPEAERFTQHGRKVGPVDYLAPEMRASPDVADPEPADVYSLSKTLWVFLADEERPLPGHYSAHEEICSLVGRISFAFAPELDRLIDLCTHNDPNRRLSMAEVARELRRMADVPPEQKPAPDTVELEQRLRDLLAPARQRLTERDEMQHTIALDSGDLNDSVINPLGNELSRKFSMLSSRTDNSPQAATLVESQGGTPPGCVRCDSWGWAYSSPNPEHPWIRLSASIYVHDFDGNCSLAAMFWISPENGRRDLEDRHFVYLCQVRAGSVDMRSSIKEIGEGVRRATPSLLRSYIQRIAG